MTLGVVVVLCVVAAASCQVLGDRSADDTDAKKLGYGELRTDVEPLAQRFAMLRTAQAVRWMSGLYGQPRNPGPSTYWIDAVITLNPDQIVELSRAHGPTTRVKRPNVVYGMREQLPAGPFRGGTALNAAFTQGSWTAQVYLAPNSHQLVLLAKGT